MDSDRQQCADQILEAIEYGQLSREEIEGRLNQIIDDELSGAIDADYKATKIEICNSLLWQLQTHGSVKLQTPSEKAKDIIKIKHTTYKRKIARVRRSIYAAVSVLVVFVGLTALGTISPIQWFTRQSIDNEQQYLIEGHEISIDYVSKAIAEHDGTENNVLSTSDPDELRAFLGFDPQFPSSLNSMYIPTKYNAIIESQSIKISVQYEPTDKISSDAQLISIRLTLFNSVEGARISYQQNAEGEYVVFDSVSVYRYTNTWTSNYLWLEGHTIVKFITSMPFDEADKYVNEIIAWRRVT